MCRHGEPVLLATFDNHLFRAASAPAEPRVEFVLEVVGQESHAMLGRGIFWEEGEQAIVDFNSSMTPGYDIFADLITNGTNDLLRDGVLWSMGGVLHKIWSPICWQVRRI